MRKNDRKEKLNPFELWVWWKILTGSWRESETKHFVRSLDKYAENAIFRTREEGKSILGERYNARNNWRSKEEREAPCAVDGRHQKCNWNLSN